MATLELSSSELEQAVAWRRMLHAKPELAYEEHATAAFVAERLAELGFRVRAGIGRTGVVGTLSRGTSRRSIAIRADMDALPIVEETGAPYASTTPGVMHACGHDGHVAMALAAALASSRMTDLDGTVHFVFQPAEEVEGGAEAMVRDGLFRDCPTDRVFGLHNWPALDTGSVVARDGAMMAAFATFEIAVSGRGSHGAMPHEGADPVAAAAQVVSALQTVTSRNVAPLESARRLRHADPRGRRLQRHSRNGDPAGHDALVHTDRRRSRGAARVGGGDRCRRGDGLCGAGRLPQALSRHDQRSGGGGLRARGGGEAGGPAGRGRRAQHGGRGLRLHAGGASGLLSLARQSAGRREPRVSTRRASTSNDAILPDGVRLWTALVAAALRA